MRAPGIPCITMMHGYIPMRGFMILILIRTTKSANHFSIRKLSMSHSLKASGDNPF